MPITKSAKKAARQSLRRTRINQRVKDTLKKAIRAAKKKLTPGTLKKAYSEIDKAAKKRIFHKNKAAHLKSRLAKLLQKKNKK